MVSHRSAQPEAYLYDESGQDAYATSAFEGPDGLDQLSGPSTFSSPTPSRFSARFARVQYDHVSVGTLAATPHRAERGLREIRSHPAALLAFTLLAQGTLRVEMGDTSFDLEVGQFVLADSRDPVAYVSTTDVRMLIAVVDVQHIPPHLRARGMTIPQALTRTPLVDSTVAFASTVLRAGAHDGPRGPHLVSAVADLQAAILAEAQESVTERTGPAMLRYRIEGYIERHYMEEDLDPANVAAGLGISIRYAHSVFNDGERTLARYIRDRRLDAIALELRTAAQRRELSEVAARHGYRGHEAMSRAFRDRFGVSPTEYRAREYRALG